MYTVTEDKTVCTCGGHISRIQTQVAGVHLVAQVCEDVYLQTDTYTSRFFSDIYEFTTDI